MKNTQFTQKDFDAAYRYLARANHLERPDGKNDNGGRWYPSDQEDCGITTEIRAPSRSFPHSYWKAAHSLNHCAALDGANEKSARKLVKIIENSMSSFHEISDAKERAQHLRMLVETVGAAHSLESSTKACNSIGMATRL